LDTIVCRKRIRVVVAFGVLEIEVIAEAQPVAVREMPRRIALRPISEAAAEDFRRQAIVDQVSSNIGVEVQR
jgi:hypothetical protein